MLRLQFPLAMYFAARESQRRAKGKNPEGGVSELHVDFGLGKYVYFIKLP